MRIVRRLLLKLPLLAFGPTLGTIAGPALAEGQKLAFGVITTSTVDDTRAAWEPFFADLRQATGLDVSGYYPPTYREAVEALIGNRIQLGWVSNKAALDCIERGNIEVFGQMIDSAGSPGYRSVIITRRDSGLKTLDQLLARPRMFGFAMGETSSTSGSVMPTYAVFAPRGIKPEAFFTPFMRGTHAETLAAVLRGRVQAGTYNTEETQRLRARDPAQAAQLRVLWESAMIPKDPLVWRKDLPLSVRTRLASFLFNYGRQPAERTRLKMMFDLAGFKPSNNQQLRFVLEIEDFRQRSEVLLDAASTEAQKNERLADLRDRYQRLARIIQTPAPTPP